MSQQTDNMPDHSAATQADAAQASRLAIVIVNYRTPGMTVDCLRSIADERTDDQPLRVTVVDGASGDDSIDVIAKAIDTHGWEWADLVALSTNGGFAFANNAAIRPLLADSQPPQYIWLLNPDTQVRPGAISAMLDFMDNTPHCAVAGSRLENPDGSPRFCAFRFHTAATELTRGAHLGAIERLLGVSPDQYLDMDQPQPVDWVSGASMVIRREVFERIGLLDEDYFMYYEEQDFCRRARRAAFECWHVPTSRVVHIPGSASGVTARRKPVKPMPGYWFASRRRFFVKHYGRLYTTWCDLLWVTGHLIWTVRRTVTRCDHNDPPRLLRDFIRYNLLPGGTRS
jgi:hypothetical protein